MSIFSKTYTFLSTYDSFNNMYHISVEFVKDKMTSYKKKKNAIQFLNF